MLKFVILQTKRKQLPLVPLCSTCFLDYMALHEKGR